MHNKIRTIGCKVIKKQLSKKVIEQGIRQWPSDMEYQAAESLKSDYQEEVIERGHQKAAVKERGYQVVAIEKQGH